tara:strand:+ start:1403 stop:2155 length:753 start_codon:yes stop_codon:yes gene_type:complete
MTKPNNKKGPETFQRDEHGLLKTVQYAFNEDGSVDWRAMIKEEHLFPNKGWFESRGKDAPRSAEGLEDYQLLIKLSGIKELARLRGFSSVSYEVEKCQQDHVAVNCQINFIENYETGRSVSFQDVANATLNNTSSFATKFLETIACNRAFVRCVRNFLNVHIVGDDEIDKSNLGPIKHEPSSSLGITPTEILKNQCGATLNCVDFSCFKDKLREFWENGAYQNMDAKKWEKYEDIPAKEARVLLKLIKTL